MRNFTKDLYKNYKVVQAEKVTALKKNTNLTIQLSKKTNIINKLEDSIKSNNHSNTIECKCKERIINWVSSQVKKARTEEKLVVNNLMKWKMNYI